MRYISDDELALCISDHERLAPYNSEHELPLSVWGYTKRPDQSCSAAHSKINQVKSAEKLLKALRGGKIHRSGHHRVWSAKGHFDSDIFLLATQAGQELPDSGPVLRRLSISKHKLMLRISDHRICYHLRYLYFTINIEQM